MSPAETCQENTGLTFRRDYSIEQDRPQENPRVTGGAGRTEGAVAPDRQTVGPFGERVESLCSGGDPHRRLRLAPCEHELALP